ncbi:hypothetical protein B0T25DRAFT_577161 [Lasiosphaeria hispida]|uniref:Chromo domain-containing protein n=1 Tax=Lasiosphaeria hispida TaxID=260671 RepID=A0AAJ0HPB7_9PEZI|nr:hypothetical protein B0T25DRAFT_577161 [Lasiosphaeria hispida]
MTRDADPGATKRKRRKRLERESLREQDTPPGTQRETEETLYAIRDIIGEKVIRGKLHYRIDWADNPQTGEQYSPTWEPAENATEVATRDWERQKRGREKSEHNEESEHSSESPVRKRRRGETRDGRDWSFVESVHENIEIVLEIAPRPDFDASEYIPIVLSRLSQESQQDGAEVSGGVNQPEVVIPDSQGLTDSLPSKLGLSDSLPRESHYFEHAAGFPSSGRIAESQPDQAPAVDSRQLLGTGPEYQIESGRNSPTHSSQEIPSRQVEDAHQGSAPSQSFAQAQHSSPGGFLTQPEFDLHFAVSSSSAAAPILSEALVSESYQGSQPTLGSIIVPATNSLPSIAVSSQHDQAAQVIPALNSNPDQIRTQSQETFDEHDTIPDTTKKPTAKAVPARAPSELNARAEKPACSTTRSSGTSSGKLVSPPFSSPVDRSTQRPRTPATPSDLDMDGSQVEETPPSTFDRLRQVRARVFGQPLSDQTSPSPAPDANVMLTQETPLVSPSTVLPGAENAPTTHQLSLRDGSNRHTSFSGHWQDVVSSAHLQSLDTGSLAKAVSGASSSDEHLSAEDLNQAMDLGLSGDLSQAGLRIHPSHFVTGRQSFEHEQIPATVAPSDLTASVDHTSLIKDALPLAQYGLDSRPSLSDANFDEPEEGKRSDFTVTLPMAASSRETYLRVMTENKATMIEFGEALATSYLPPSESLVAKMDAMFEQLLEICDLPAWAKDIPNMGPGEMMRHATNTNSKFLFVYEFLNDIRDLSSRVLILSRPGLAFEYLEAVVAASDFAYTVLGRGIIREQDSDGMDVVLATTNQDLSTIRGQIDIVIAFDYISRSVELPPSLAYDDVVVVLSLLVTHSLEHVDFQLGQLGHELDGIERKGALNLALATTKDLLRNPESGHPEPHDAASIFANFFRNPESGLNWEHRALPDDIFDVWLSSQVQPESSGDVSQHQEVLNGPTNRKRTSDDEEEGRSKRARVLEIQQPGLSATPVRISDLLRNTLSSHPATDKSLVQLLEVPVGQLELMATKIAELEERLVTQAGIEARLREHTKSIEAQLQSHVRTERRTQPKYYEALRDRRDSERARRKAEEQVVVAKKRLEASTLGAESLKERIKTLDSELAEANMAMATSSVPDIARLAKTEKELAEAQAKIQSLEKKVASTLKETEYSRSAYQGASNSFGEVNRENQDLKEKVKSLDKRASDNVVKIHEINANSQLQAVGKQLDEYQAIIRDREFALERARDELRHLKNGRRETRQASVPRSPRTGVMSPRPGRGGGVSSGTGSRGTSPAPTYDGATGGASGAPVPGMTYFNQPPGNGRWTHLRD